MTTPSIERRLLRRTFISRSLPAGWTQRDIARACAEEIAAAAGLPVGEWERMLRIGDEVPTAPTLRGRALYGNVEHVLADAGLVIDQNCIHIRTAEPIDPEDLLERAILGVVKLSQNMSRSPSPAKNRGGRPEHPLWPKVHTEIDKHLEENGYPERGDRKQAEIEKFAATFFGDDAPAESTIRSHVTSRIKLHKETVGAA
jgi:hypothetical protein